MSLRLASRAQNCNLLLSAGPTSISFRQASATTTKPSHAPPILSYHWDTQPPTSSNLSFAERFFRPPAQLLYSSPTFRSVRPSDVPEVAFLGRSNVGKSSLLNALTEQKICHTSKHPGRTRSMNFFAVGGPDGRGSEGKLAILDCPGYGKGSREEWGGEIVKYLVQRKQYAAIGLQN